MAQLLSLKYNNMQIQGIVNSDLQEKNPKIKMLSKIYNNNPIVVMHNFQNKDD